MVSFGNPVRGPRIVPFGTARTNTDYLANGHPAFRVTQRFGDWDVLLRDRIHGALDIANYYCGDSVLAAESGNAIPLSDPNGAQGVEVRHADGYRTQYWHLSRRASSLGSVTRGETVGWVGQTGLDISGCHLHFVALNPSGKPVDPWPLLAQNQASANAVKFDPDVDGVNLRSGPDSRSDNVLATAYKDSDPPPNGIIWRSNGKRVGSTSSPRRLYAVVKGADGALYNKLRIAGTGRDSYVQSRFMRRV